jgi:hypothetical protein
MTKSPCMLLPLVLCCLNATALVLADKMATYRDIDCNLCQVSGGMDGLLLSLPHPNP